MVLFSRLERDFQTHSETTVIEVLQVKSVLITVKMFQPTPRIRESHTFRNVFDIAKRNSESVVENRQF